MAGSIETDEGAIVSRANDTRVVVLSIDGVPFGLAKQFMNHGTMPNLAKLAQKTGGARTMRSVQPTVSCVAWASYMTGMNPGKHGIYGFIDRQKGTYDLMFPNARTMAVKNIWEILSDQGRRVFGMNVPCSYPPRPVNGILIGGFLSPSIEKAAYPATEAQYLKSIDYRLDSDAQLARQDKKAMLKDLDVTLNARMEAMFHYLNQEPWDFFHTHIMGSDRINHFLLEKAQQGDPEFAPAFRDYYRKIDGYIGKLLETLGPDVPLLIFSDHGFCPIKQEVQLSRYLIEKGWTQTAQPVRHPLSIDPQKSKAYCLIPGRVYVNLQGREPGGIVPVQEFEQVRQQLKNDLLALRDPDNGAQVIRKVMTREELYWPKNADSQDPVYARAADLVAIPYDGYDLKLGLGGSDVFKRTELEGMHTYDDAFMIARNVELPQDGLEIMMVARAILKRMDAAVPKEMDGDGSLVTPAIV